MEPNAILAINSLDRYNKNQGAGGQLASFGASLVNQYNLTGQPCNDFQVGGFGALIYGYIKKIQVSQIQLQYNVPTVIPDKNDGLWITNGFQPDFITIPYGFYTPEELASMIQFQLSTTNVAIQAGGITVTYNPIEGYFTFASANTGAYPQIAFPTLAEIEELTGDVLNYDATQNALRTYILLGINVNNSSLSLIQSSRTVPQFLYTPYVDIFSTALTKYQKVKDNTTSPSTDSTLVARIYLSGVGVPQNAAGERFQTTFNGDILSPVPVTNYAYPLGSRPFVITQDCNTPKVVRWSKDETVYALDFQLRDQYGDLIFTRFQSSDIFYTEFQMTLMCIEGGRE